MRSAQDSRVIKAVAAEVKARRGQLDISQDEMAYRAGLNRSFVAKVEVARSQPTVAVFVRLAQALETDPATLIQFILQRSRLEQ